MADILPTFREASFHFEAEVPPHIEAYPSIPNYIGMYALFGAIDGTRSYPLAVDVEGLLLIQQLAQAREEHQERTIKLYGYTDDIYIAHPDGTFQRTYYGRSC